MRFTTILIKITIIGICLFHELSAQSVNEFPKKTDKLFKKVALYEKLMVGNHWNEGAIMQHVIFPPAGLDRPIVGSQADCLDPTSEMLVALSFKYSITKDPQVKRMADQIFEAIEKLEKVTGVSGLFARSFNQTDKALWHEKACVYLDAWIPLVGGHQCR